MLSFLTSGPRHESEFLSSELEGGTFRVDGAGVLSVEEVEGLLDLSDVLFS